MFRRRRMYPATVISIHAPREGGDTARRAEKPYKQRISIHAPREGGDFQGRIQSFRPMPFQSTPPARGAT